MGTTTTTVTVTTCDRCGRETTGDPLAAWGGYGKVQQDSTLTTYDGATGGTTRDLLLCGRCDHSLTEFLHGGGAAPLVKDGTDDEYRRWASTLRELLRSADASHILTEASVTGRTYIAKDVLDLADAIRAHREDRHG